MGSLGDGIAQGQATGARVPDGAALGHPSPDDFPARRARGLDRGSDPGPRRQGRKARDRFAGLSKDKQAKLLGFLKKL